MKFSISYENAKKILEVFYNSPYLAALPYIEILHNMKQRMGPCHDLHSTPIFKEKLDEEKSKAATPDKAIVDPKEE